MNSSNNRGINLKERMFNAVTSFAEEYKTFEDFISDMK